VQGIVLEFEPTRSRQVHEEPRLFMLGCISRVLVSSDVQAFLHACLNGLLSHSIFLAPVFEEFKFCN
jgi:hypothetical protein